MKRFFMLFALAAAAYSQETSGFRAEANWRNHLNALEQSLIRHGDGRLRAALLTDAFNDYNRDTNEITADLLWQQLHEQDLYLMDLLAELISRDPQMVEYMKHDPQHQDPLAMLKFTLHHGTINPDALVCFLVQHMDRAAKLPSKH